MSPAQKKRQNLTKECDALFGKIVRSRGACESCGTLRDLQCAHGFSRRYRATRWDERQCFALCRGCHLKYTVRPLEWDEWLRARLGPLYDEIRALALNGAPPDLKATRERLTVLLRQIEEAA